MNFAPFEVTIGHTFTNPLLLKQAFVHRSYLNEHPDCEVGHNERLEFLGDAVIELVVTEHLYKEFPNEPEGKMTNWRAALVNAVMLATVAKALDFEPYLFLSRGETEDKGKARQYILANAFESVVGAMYLDAGYAPCTDFLQKHLLTRLPRILDDKSWIDPKSRFQEAAQELLSVTPTYRVMKETGPDHARRFIIGVYIGKELIAEGEGSSKQEAQVAAAEKAIAVKGW